jgi:hypothetical protein
MSDTQRGPAPQARLVDSAIERARLLLWLGLSIDERSPVWVVRKDAEVCGAAALVVASPHALAWVRVADRHQRIGIGRALGQTLTDHASSSGLHHLGAARPVDSRPAAWALAIGWRAVGTLTEFSASLAVSMARQRIAWARVERSVPPDCRILSLREAAAQNRLEAIAHTLAPAVGGRPERWMARAERSLRNPARIEFDPDCSVIMLLGDQVIGAQTTRFDPLESCWFNEAITVIPEFRRGWASIALRIAAGEAKQRAALFDEVRFRARNDHPDTLRMARHLGAETRWTRHFLQWSRA